MIVYYPFSFHERERDQVLSHACNNKVTLSIVGSKIQLF